MRESPAAAKRQRPLRRGTLLLNPRVQEPEATRLKLAVNLVSKHVEKEIDWTIRKLEFLNESRRSKLASAETLIRSACVSSRRFQATTYCAVGGGESSLRRGSRAWMREPASRDGFTASPRQRRFDDTERRHATTLACRILNPDLRITTKRAPHHNGTNAKRPAAASSNNHANRTAAFCSCNATTGFNRATSASSN